MLKDVRSDAEGAEMDPAGPERMAVDVSVEETIWANVIYFYTAKHLREDGGLLVGAQKYALAARLDVKI